ncbi:MAG: hypothetical protein GC161_12150 [Planctomycetaceae bacterium]|nr:hypothetical protein [Planctomycetaceae bacterium]
MALEFKLPDIGEGIAEGEIVKWLVAEGDTVAEHQSVVEVMTDKATVEVPAPKPGRITSIKAKEGEVVPVGSVIWVMDTEGGAPAQKAAPKAEPAKPAAKAAAAPAKPAPQAAAPAAKQPASSTPSGGGARLDFKLPDIGEGIAEGEIVKWLVEVGAVVEEHQAVVEVMTDKATVEVPAPRAGKILEFNAKEGQVVPVGSVIFSMQTASGSAPMPSSGHAHGDGSAASSNGQPAAAAPAAAAAPSNTASANAKVLAVPSARRVARELGVDLSQVSGSGPNGVVRRADVESFSRGGSRTAAAATTAAPASALPARPAPAPISLGPTERETRKPFRGVRRKISEAMVRSKYTAPHFTVVEEIDVTELVALREKGKAIAAEQGVKLTYMPFIMKATALALAKYPQLGSALDEASQEHVIYNYVDLGIAMDTDNGLIVPVIRDVQQKGLLQLGAELAELADRTRSGKVKPEELKGSTFSITNAGNIGGILATPIINFPNAAILGVHRIVKRPGVFETPDGDEIGVRQYMNLSISVDHRLVDGADGARFLVHMRRLLENPGLLSF